MEIFFDKRRKLVVAIILIATILTISISSFAAEVLHTGGLNNGDKLKFTGYSWTVYSTKAAGKKANGNGIRYIKNGEVITLVSIAKDCNVIKIGTGEFIYYGKNASEYFKKVDSTVKVTEVSLNKPSATLEKGKTLTLKATIRPNNATNKNVKWESDNKKVATVDANGKVTAVGVGNATIKATAQDGSNKNATCKITVNGIKVTSITLNKISATLEKGKTLTLKATVKPSNATNKNIAWESDNKKVATVDANGKVTAVGVGNATIRAIAQDGSNKSAAFTITVNEPKVAVTGVTINGKTNLTKSMRVGYTIELTSAVKPSNAIQNVTWTSSNKKVATVDDKGNVTSNAAGTAIITATSTQDKNKKATCAITVIQQVDSLEFENKVYEITKGKSLKITATIKPANAQSNDIEWNIEDTKIAKIEAISKDKKTVKISGLRSGETVLIAKIRTTDRSSGYKTAKAKIKVVIPVTKVTITTPADKRTMEKDKTAKLTAKVEPTNATNKTLKWTSLDPKIVRIDDEKNGKVTAVGVGTTTITVMSTDGTQKQASIKITVRDTSKKYVYSGNTYKIAVTAEKLNSVLVTIKNKNIYQKGTTSLSGRCGYVASYHVKLLRGAEEEEYASHTKAYNCGYGTKHSYNNAKDFYATIKANIDNGKAMRVKVSNSSYSQHFVTIVGYKGNCNRFSDLLMLGAYSGKLIVYGGTGAGEINKGLNGYELRF